MTAVTDPLMDEEMPRARLGLLLQHFSELDDDREPWRVMYPLKEVLLLVTCATIASCDDFDDIVAWGEHHLDTLRRFSTFHHGIPCRMGFPTSSREPSTTSASSRSSGSMTLGSNFGSYW